MLNPHHPLHASIVRICDEEGTIHGVGFLAEPGLVCTCAHVVADALNISPKTEQRPEGEVYLDFPFLGGVRGTACIQVWVPMKPNDGGDIAMLRLTSAPPLGARSARLLPVDNLSGRDFAAYGYPNTTDFGQWAYGVLRDRLTNDWVELQGTTAQGYRVQRGYSGTPVWDQRGGGVVGMVVAEDRNPEAKEAFLIPNDLIRRACSDIVSPTLSQPFALLTDGLMGLPGNPLDGVEQFLHEYLGTPEVPAPFGGRQMQLAELDRWLTSPEQPYALLVAEAGRGKSALVTRWVAGVANEQRADVAFVPISIRFNTALKSTALRLLVARLHHLHHVKAGLPHDTEAWLAEIDLYLREDRPIDSPLLIVLDGADEAIDWILGQDLPFPPKPGRGIKVLVSARPLADCDAVGWMQRLKWQGKGVPMKLPLLDRSGVTEVLQSMGDPPATPVTLVDTVDELQRLSEGDPLLVRLYAEALRGTGERAAFLTPEDLRHLKPGLEPYFDQWWDDQRRQWSTTVPLKEPTVRVLLNLFACALGPLSTDDLLALMKPERCNLWILGEALRPLARFVVGDGRKQSYVFSHPRLNQYFYEKLPLRERQAWEHRFISYGRQTLATLTSGECDPRKVSSYPVRYYGAHLERGGAHPDHFDELVSEGWQRAWEALEGTYDGFLSDLMRAWKQAEASGAQAQSTGERGRAIGRQCRYALIVASIKSLAGNIPPALLAELVDKGVWTPIQGLADARQIPDEEQRAWALSDLAPHLSEPLLREALAMVQAMVDQDRRAEALRALVPHLPEPLLRKALAVARAMADAGVRAAALSDLAPYLSESLRTTVLQEALAAARTIKSEDRRAAVLRGLAPYLPEPLLQEALAMTRAMADQDRRAAVLRGLASHLSEPLRTTVLQEALAAARTIKSEDRRAAALSDLAPYLPEPLLREALAMVQAMADQDRRAEALGALAPYLSEPLLRKALAAARTIVREDSRAEVLGALAPYLSEPLLQEALALPIRGGDTWAWVLTNLAPYLSEPLRTTVLQEALAIARTIVREDRRAQALGALAPYLSEPLLREALAAARTIVKGDSRAETLRALVPHLSEPLRTTVLQEALAAARTIVLMEDSRAETLRALAPYLSEPLRTIVLRGALATVRTIKSEDRRALALGKLVPHVKQLPVIKLYALWCETLRTPVIRCDLLSDIRGLAPVIEALSGKEALVAIAQAIIEVGKWFP